MSIAAILAARKSEVITATPDMRVIDVVGLLAERRIGAVPIMADGQVVGIFSERDVIYGLKAAGPAFLDQRIGDCMTHDVVTVGEDVPLLTALAMMTKRRIRHLPVVERGQMIGFLSIGDLVKMRIDRIESEAEALREYIQSA